MKKILTAGLIGLGLLSGSVNASTKKDTTINFYGVNAQTDKSKSSKNGLGVMYDSEAIKLKLERTSDFTKFGSVFKYNLNAIDEKLYLKVGVNGIIQKMYAPDNSTANVNQYSGALATGYMVFDDLYVELGGSYTKLNGKKLSSDYEIVDETTKLVYFEVAKRWDLSSYGTLDTTANIGKVVHEFKDNDASYGLGMDYYLDSNSKVGYKYQNEQNNIANNYLAQHDIYFAEFTDKISADTHNIMFGVKFVFDDITDFSSYRAPKNIKPHLSELHRFEDVSFGSNMQIQSSGGVKETAEKIARDNAPIINAIATQAVNDNGGGLATSILTVAGTNIRSGAVFSIVSDPTSGKLTINASTGELIWDGDVVGNQNYNITIKVVNTDNSEDTETFILNVTDNA